MLRENPPRPLESEVEAPEWGAAVSRDQSRRAKSRSRSARCWSSGRRTRAWMPDSRTVPSSRRYFESRVSSRSAHGARLHYPPRGLPPHARAGANPPVGPGDRQGLPRRVLAEARSGARLSHGVRRRPSRKAAGSRRSSPKSMEEAALGVLEASLILEEINHSPGNSAVCHAQMYVMGTLLRHGSEEQKKQLLPGIARGEVRLQAFGVTEPGAGSDTTKLTTFARRAGDRYIVKRSEGLDLAHRALRLSPAPRAHHAGRRGREEDRGTLRLSRRPSRGYRQGHHRPSHPHDDEPPFLRALHRRTRGAGREPRGRGRAGVPLHPRRYERREDPDRRRMHRRCSILPRPRERATPRSAWSSVVPSGRTREFSFPWLSPTPTRRPRTWFVSAPQTLSTGKSPRERTRTSRSSWRRTPRGRRETPRSRRSAGSASRRSTTSKENCARPGSTRWRRSRRI